MEMDMPEAYLISIHSYIHELTSITKGKATHHNRHNTRIHTCKWIRCEHK